MLAAAVGIGTPAAALGLGLVLGLVLLAWVLRSPDGRTPMVWLGGVGIGFGFIGLYFGVFSFIEFFNVVSRLWGTAAESLILVAVPMFIFMGTMLERSGVANDLLYCLQVLLRKTPGGLAL